MEGANVTAGQGSADVADFATAERRSRGIAKGSDLGAGGAHYTNRSDREWVGGLAVNPFVRSVAPSDRVRARLQHLRLILRADRELRREEAMLLRHRRLGAVDHVVHELPSIRRLDPLAVDVIRPLLVADEEVVATGPASDVDVLAQLDEAVGADDRETSVAPGGQPIRREPVIADVAGAAVAADHHVTEVLELRVLGMVRVAHLRGDDLAARGARVVEELVELV